MFDDIVKSGLSSLFSDSEETASSETVQPEEKENQLEERLETQTDPAEEEQTNDNQTEVQATDQAGDSEGKTEEAAPGETDQADPVKGSESNDMSASAPSVIYEGDTVITAVTEARPILTTPINDYSVTEGLLLLILIVLVVRMVFDAGRRLF